MFKEFFCGVLVLLILYLALRFFCKKNNGLPLFAVWILLGLFALLSTLYNSVNILPNTYLETSTGVFRYGTCSENLFAWSDEFRYRDEILFPILRERKVAIDENGDFYRRFFTLFSAKAYETPLSIPDNVRRAILEDESAFTFESGFNIIGLTDYAKDEIPQSLRRDFEEKIFPSVRINTDSLEGETELVAMVTEDYSLYLMGRAYYDSKGR